MKLSDFLPTSFFPYLIVLIVLLLLVFFLKKPDKKNSYVAKEALLKGGLSEVETKAIMDYFGITKFGNFEHQSTNPILTCNEKPDRLDEAIAILKEESQKVAYPFIDTKILTSWNALMVTALFEAGKSEKAKNVLDTLLKSLHVNGILYHQIVLGGSLKVEALLEDYAFVIESLLRGYTHT